MKRAYDTARTICRGQPVQRDSRWREFAFGEWEGLTWEEIVERFPEAAQRQWSSAKDYAPPGGETFAAVQTRVGQALADLQERRYAHVLVVTHAGPLHAMLHTLFGDREPEMEAILAVRFSPASVTRIALGERAELLSLNEVAHLAV